MSNETHLLHYDLKKQTYFYLSPIGLDKPEYLLPRWLFFRRSDWY
jgi:hypothetical protein